MQRLGTKLVVTAGLLTMAAGFAVAAGSTGLDSAYWGRIVIAMVLMAGGLALSASPATEAIMGALPLGQAGAGSAVNDTVREVGGTLGVAVVGSVMSTVYGPRSSTALTAAGAPAAGRDRAAPRTRCSPGCAVAGQLPDRRPAAAVQQSFMDGVFAGSLGGRALPPPSGRWWCWRSCRPSTGRPRRSPNWLLRTECQSRGSSGSSSRSPVPRSRVCPRKKAGATRP